MEFVFLECSRCHGLGTLDCGDNCKQCGGSGSGGLFSTNGCIGSGEMIIDKVTGRVVPHSEFTALMATARSSPSQTDT